MTTEGLRKCTGCKETKPINDFGRRVSRHTGKIVPDSKCKTCLNARARDWRINSADKAKIIHRRAWLKNKYGISVKRYDHMMELTGGKCYICGATRGFVRGDCVANLCVDHCHDTGAVRGLLCNECNRGIAYLKHDVGLLKIAINYLQSGKDFRDYRCINQ